MQQFSALCPPPCDAHLFDGAHTQFFDLWWAPFTQMSLIDSCHVQSLLVYIDILQKLL